MSITYTDPGALCVTACAAAGVACYKGAFRPTEVTPSAPDPYCVYNMQTVGLQAYDDRTVVRRYIIYLDLWGSGDLEMTHREIRAQMEAAGFTESDAMEHFKSGSQDYVINMTYKMVLED